MIAMLITGNDREGMLSLKGIMFPRFALLFAVWVAFGLYAGAAATDPKQLYDQSTDALYNLDFNTAQSGYEALAHDFPNDPIYWNALASSVWLKITFEQQKLNLESFSNKTTFGTKESRDTVDPADEKRLRDTLNTAVSKADAILKKKPDDIHALYEKGVSEATLASFEGTVKRSYLSAINSANASRHLHQQVLKLDPNFDDARLSIGTYDYVVGVVPAFIRIGLGLFGINSSGKDAGIHEIEIAATKGKTSSTEARMVLSVIYSREKRYDDALRMMSELHNKYPRNFLFELAEASTFGKMKRWNDAERTYEEVLTKIHSRADGYDRVRIERVYYLIAMNDIQSEHFEKAMEDLNRVTSGHDATPDEKADSHMWLGKIFDSKKDRTRAIAQYEAILELNCSPGFKADAEKYRRRPWGE